VQCNFNPSFKKYSTCGIYGGKSESGAGFSQSLLSDAPDSLK